MGVTEMGRKSDNVEGLGILGTGVIMLPCYIHGDDMAECCCEGSLCVVNRHRYVNTLCSAFDHILRLSYQLSVLDTQTHTELVSTL